MSGSVGIWALPRTAGREFGGSEVFICLLTVPSSSTQGVELMERPPPKVAPVGMTPGGVLLRENRMYGSAKN